MFDEDEYEETFRYVDRIDDPGNTHLPHDNADITDIMMMDTVRREMEDPPDMDANAIMDNIVVTAFGGNVMQIRNPEPTGIVIRERGPRKRPRDDPNYIRERPLRDFNNARNTALSKVVRFHDNLSPTETQVYLCLGDARLVINTDPTSASNLKATKTNNPKLALTMMELIKGGSNNPIKVLQDTWDIGTTLIPESYYWGFDWRTYYEGFVAASMLQQVDKEITEKGYDILKKVKLYKDTILCYMDRMFCITVMGKQVGIMCKTAPSTFVRPGGEDRRRWANVEHHSSVKMFTACYPELSNIRIGPVSEEEWLKMATMGTDIFKEMFGDPGEGQKKALPVAAGWLRKAERYLASQKKYDEANEDKENDEQDQRPQKRSRLTVPVKPKFPDTIVWDATHVWFNKITTRRVSNFVFIPYGFLSPNTSNDNIRDKSLNRFPGWAYSPSEVTFEHDFSKLEPIIDPAYPDPIPGNRVKVPPDYSFLFGAGDNPNDYYNFGQVYDLFIKNVWCKGDQAKYKTVKGMFTHNLINPEKEKVKYCLVIIGEQGAGKSLVMMMFRSLFPPNCSAWLTCQKSVTGNFQQKGAETRMVTVLEEANLSASPRDVDLLKTWITENEQTVNYKHENAVLCDNWTSIYIITNERDPMPFEVGSRRWFIVDVGNSAKGNIPFFEWFSTLAKRPGSLETLMYVLTRPSSLEDWNPNKCPFSVELQRAQERNLTGVNNWWHKCLKNGITVVVNYKTKRVFDPIGVSSLENTEEVVEIESLHNPRQREEMRMFNKLKFSLEDEMKLAEIHPQELVINLMRAIEDDKETLAWNRFVDVVSLYTHYKAHCSANGLQCVGEAKWRSDWIEIAGPHLIEEISCMVSLSPFTTASKSFIKIAHVDLCRAFWMENTGWLENTFYTDKDDPRIGLLGSTIEKTIKNIRAHAEVD